MEVSEVLFIIGLFSLIEKPVKFISGTVFLYNQMIVVFQRLDLLIRLPEENDSEYKF